MKLNHILVLTSDLNAMEHFWTKIIGLKVGKRPPFPFAGLWLYSGDIPLIHVAEQKGASLAHGSIAHVAFDGADYEALISRLKQSKQPYTEKDVPLSGDRQVFIAGPDGVTVEMMFPLNQMKSTLSDANRKDYQQDADITFLGSAQSINIME